jgi:hypothetical protein
MADALDELHRNKQAGSSSALITADNFIRKAKITGVRASSIWDAVMDG